MAEPAGRPLSASAAGTYSTMRDPDFVEARATIRALQTALDHAHARIRENELVIAALNARMAAATELFAMMEAHQDVLQRAQSSADISP